MNKIEVLVATMNQSNLSLAKEMNLQTNAVIINQCKDILNDEKIINGNKIRMYSYDERGLAKSRNRALRQARADICVIADDDVIYVDGYEKVILNAFRKIPDADIIIFNIKSLNPERPSIQLNKIEKINYMSFMKYGSCRIAFKRSSIDKYSIKFDELFGAGSVYTSGEDTIFMNDCLKNKLKIYTYPDTIACVKQDESSWFNGYNEKYFSDKGAIFARISKKYSKLLNLQFTIRKYSCYKNRMSPKKILKLMNEGRNNYFKSVKR